MPITFKKHLLNLILGLVVAIMPLTGFPPSFKTFVYIVAGLAIAYFSYTLTKS